MNRQTNIHEVSARLHQRSVMRILKPGRLVIVLGIGLTIMGCGDGGDDGMARAQNTGRDFVAPTVFQAAGPDIASIQNTVEQYRTALGATNNGNAAGPLRKEGGGRRMHRDE